MGEKGRKPPAGVSVLTLLLPFNSQKVFTMNAITFTDPLATALAEQALAAIEKVVAGNEELTGETSDGTTSVREIDKVLRDDEVEKPESISKAWQKYVAAEEKAKALKEEARNLYRTEVLGEEEKQETVSNVDKDALKEIRKTAMETLSFLCTYGKANGKKEIVEWAESISVPSVGRAGSSGITGNKKPRVFVKVDGTVYDSFTLAAQGLSTKEQKFTAGELSAAWAEAGGAEGEFDYSGRTFDVTFKPKKAAA